MEDSQSLRETCKRMAMALRNALLHAGSSQQEARALVRKVVATSLLLRSFDYAEAEQEATAVLEDRVYQPLLPPKLQWRHWSRLEEPAALAERLRALAARLERIESEGTQLATGWMQHLAAPLQDWAQVDPIHWRHLVHSIGDLPFETPSERRAILEMLDWVLAERGEAYDGESQTPVSVAGLVAALAQPQLGERVYDPCFGSGNLLIAAWQHAERNSPDARLSDPLLRVSGVELRENAFLIGLTRMVLAGIDHPQLEIGNSLEPGRPHSPSTGEFDLVLANPPIGPSSSRDKWEPQHFAFPTADSVGLFIQHALTLLKPQGRCVIVVPEGFLFRGGAVGDLRRHLVQKRQIEAVVGLPAGAFAPYSQIKTALLLLRRQGSSDWVRMVDAAAMFDSRGRSRNRAPTLRAEMALQLAQQLRRADLHELRGRPPGVSAGTGGSGVLARSIWEVSIDQLAATDWDLSPRRREQGGLHDMLAGLQEALGDQCSVVPLKSVAQVMAGRAIPAEGLIDESAAGAEQEPLTPYLRIKDLQQGKVRRASSWLRPHVAAQEKRWAVLPGDVLLSKSGTIGKIALVERASGAIPSSGLYVLRADATRLDPFFLVAYLESASTQGWFAARARGAAIQHLNRAVIDELPVLLPPIPMQVRAAEQFRERGDDVLSFLLKNGAIGEADRAASWLAELKSKLPTCVIGFDPTPPLSALDAVVPMVTPPLEWLEIELEDIDREVLWWLRPLVDAVRQLAGVSRIPAGPGLLSVLQDAERTLLDVTGRADGSLPVEALAREVAEDLREWLRALIDELCSQTELRIEPVPDRLVRGGHAEFTVNVRNGGVLPLRALQIDTIPEWGTGATSYLAEGAALPLVLSGNIPKFGEYLALKLHWRARTLSGEQVAGFLDLKIQLDDTAALAAEGLAAEMSGNPYVTGTPLGPQHGHSVFYGREKLIEQVSSQIATHGNVVLLEGNRRAGKTSILRHLEGRSAIPGWLAVYASLQAAEGAARVVGVPTAEVFRLVAFELAKGIAALHVETPLPDGSSVKSEALFGLNKFDKLQEGSRIRKACHDGISERSSFADFRDYLEVLLAIAESQNVGVVLMLDEFDKLQEGIDSGVTSPQLPENLRFLIQTHRRFSAILTGSRRLKRLREEYWSALYGLGTSVLVTALEVDSARRVVTEPVRGRVAFSDEAVNQVIKLTARQPYLIQCLCNRIFEFARQAKARSVTVALVADAANALVRDNEHFASLWDYAARGPKTGAFRRQLILLQCALAFKQGARLSFGTLLEQLAQTGVETDEAGLDIDLAYLRELDLVEFSGAIGDGQYELAIPLMAQWIEQHQDAEVVKGRARAEAEEEHA